MLLVGSQAAQHKDDLISSHVETVEKSTNTTKLPSAYITNNSTISFNDEVDSRPLLDDESVPHEPSKNDSDFLLNETATIDTDLASKDSDILKEEDVSPDTLARSDSVSDSTLLSNSSTMSSTGSKAEKEYDTDDINSRPLLDDESVPHEPSKNDSDFLLNETATIDTDLASKDSDILKEEDVSPDTLARSDSVSDSTLLSNSSTMSSTGSKAEKEYDTDDIDSRPLLDDESVPHEPSKNDSDFLLNETATIDTDLASKDSDILKEEDVSPDTLARSDSVSDSTLLSNSSTMSSTGSKAEKEYDTDDIDSRPLLDDESVPHEPSKNDSDFLLNETATFDTEFASKDSDILKEEDVSPDTLARSDSVSDSTLLSNSSTMSSTGSKAEKEYDTDDINSRPLLDDESVPHEPSKNDSAETEKEGRNKIHGKGQCPLAQMETLPTAKFAHARKAQ